MQVTKVTISPSSGCPGDRITAKAYVTMLPGFDKGTVNFYVREYLSDSGKYTSWQWMHEVTGINGGLLGGQEIAEAKFTIPNRRSAGNITGNVFVGAVATGQTSPVSAVFTAPHEDTGWVVSATPTSGPAPLTVTFTATKLSTATNVNWDFYDGSTGKGKTITHTYQKAGLYTAAATPVDRCGRNYTTTKFTSRITVGDPRCKNPDGAPGSYECISTTRVKCVDGLWNVIQRNSPECGYVAPKRDCTNPRGVHGGYDCSGTTRIKCDDGRWVTIEHNSRECGYRPPDPPDPPDEPDPPDPPTYRSCKNPTGRHGDYECDGTTRIKCDDGEWAIHQRNSPHCIDDEPDIPDEPDPPDPPRYKSCTNPAGEHDEYDCDGTTMMRCYNGSWIIHQYNSPECGYALKPCTNPTGEHGGHDCDGTTRIRCHNGEWFIVEYNSTHCGYTPPPKHCFDPPGAHGSTRCDNTTLYECDDGQWVFVEADSEQCNYTPPTQNCSNPHGIPGATRCDDTTLVQCRDGQWVALEYNSAECQPDRPDSPDGPGGWIPALDRQQYIYLGVGAAIALGLGYMLSR